MTMNKNNETQNKQVYGNESFGIPSDCTKKQKFSGVKLAIYIVVVALLCSGVYVGFQEATYYLLPSVTFDKTNKPVFYVTTKTLSAKYEKEQRSRTISEDEKIYSDMAVSEKIYITPDAKYVFYPGKVNDDNTFDLFLRADGEPLCIAENVTSYKAHPKGQFVLYIKDSALYISDLKKPKMISLGVTDFYLSKNGQQITYFKDGGRMYTCTTGKELKTALVDSDITKLLTPKDEYVDIYYIKDNSLYHKKTGEDGVVIAENVFDGIVLGENVYFTRKEMVERPMTEYIYDDMLREDKEIIPPKEEDFLTENILGEEVLDVEAYRISQERYEQKVTRDLMRDYFAADYIPKEEFTLYSIRRNGEVKIDEMLKDGYLNYNSCKDTIVYEKNVLKKDEIVMSELSSAQEAALGIEKLLSEEMETCMQVLVKGKRPFEGTESFPDGHIEISLDGKFIYCIENIKSNGKGTLVRYSVSGRELKDRKELRESVTDFALDGSDSTVTAIFDGAKMGICVGETYTHLSDNTCKKFYYVDGTLFFYDNYNFQTQAGQLKIFRDGKVKLIDNRVYDFDVRNYRTVSYIKDYNHDSGSGILYVKEGNQKRKIDIGVKDILY